MPTKAIISLMAVMLTFSPLLSVGIAAKSEYNISQSDKTYLAGAGVLRVSAVPEQSPLLSYSKTTGEITGATTAVLSYLSERTGAELELVPAATTSELAALISENKVDLVLNFPHDEKAAEQYGLRLTEPYYTFRTQLVRRADIGREEMLHRTAARPSVFSFEGKGEGFDAIYYDEPYKCFEAVKDGRADYCYIPEYYSVMVLGGQNYNNIAIEPRDEPVQSVCIGVARAENERVASIIGSTIEGMPSHLMGSEMMRYIDQTRLEMAVAETKSQRQKIMLMGIVCICALAVAGCLIYVTAKANRKMLISNERYTLLTDLANEFSFDYDYKTRMFTFSDKCAKAFGCPSRLKNENTVLCRYGQGTMPRKLSELLQSGGGRRDSTSECEMLMAGGERRWFRVISTTLSDVREKTVLVVGKILDVQSQIQEKTELLQRSQIDGLTGIYNAAASRELIGKAIKGRQGRGGGALWIIDIDRFKMINDTLGHDVGDDTLRGFSDVLNSHFRQRDIVGRLGGDEFVVWMADGVTNEVMRGRCKSLCEKARAIDPVGAKENGVRVSISVGVAVLNTGDDFTSLYKRADKALYQAKNDGRDRYVISGEAVCFRAE